jgi:TRAP transporter TAXI family solute receptor
MGCGLLAGCGSSDKTFISIGTGGQTGVYYPTGNAIKRIVESTPGHRLHLSVAASGGSVENINNVIRQSVTFGVAQADRQFQAFQGEGNWENNPQTDLRFVFSLHPEVVTLVAAADSGITSVQNLRGKRVNLGSPGSGHRGNATAILATAGIPLDDLQAESLQAAECAQKLQDGVIDAYFYTVGHPAGSITESTTGRRKVRFVPINQMETLLQAAPYYTATRVPVELYPQAVQEGEVPSIGMLTTVVTHADTSDETVYTFVKAVFERLDDLRPQHPALQSLTPEGMLRGEHAPLHPGAKRYYQEAGLLPADVQ